MHDPDTADGQFSRRAFLSLLGNGAIAFTLGGFIQFLGHNDHFVRPPRAREEEVFLSLCLRCDKCAEACPWGLISPVPLTESIINAGTPVLQGYCRNCWLCVDACPTNALR